MILSILESRSGDDRLAANETLANGAGPCARMRRTLLSAARGRAARRQQRIPRRNQPRWIAAAHGAGDPPLLAGRLHRICDPRAWLGTVPHQIPAGGDARRRNRIGERHARRQRRFGCGGYDPRTGKPLKFTYLPAKNDPETHEIRATLPIPVPQGGIGRVLIYKTYKDERTYMMHGEDIVWVRSLSGYRLGVILPLGFAFISSNVAAQQSVTEDGRLKLAFANPSGQSNPVTIHAHKTAAAFAATPYNDMFFDDVKTLYDLDAPETHKIKVEQTYSDYRKGETAKLDSLAYLSPARSQSDRSRYRQAFRTRARKGRHCRQARSAHHGLQTERPYPHHRHVAGCELHGEGRGTGLRPPAAWIAQHRPAAGRLGSGGRLAIGNRRRVSGPRVCGAHQSQRRERIPRDHPRAQGQDRPTTSWRYSANRSNRAVDNSPPRAVQNLMPTTSRRGFLASSLGAAAVARFAGAAASSELCALTLKQASDSIRSKKVSPVELTEACLDRIKTYNPKINAWITVMGEKALAQAKTLAEEQAAGKLRSPLHGIPIGVKDSIDAMGARATAASAVYEYRFPSEDAEVVRRLRAAGAVIVGKCNMHEFDAGASSAVSYWGPVRNPWNLERVSGGPSGGSAAAVAMENCFGALGTDTGGGIRTPAAYCGVVGFKPTYGRVSLRGIVPFAWSLDHCGPIARTVEDAAMLLQQIAGLRPPGYR